MMTPDLKWLHQHLQWAIELEHTTIPPYLCALYSIPDGSNVRVSGLIRSVVMEEMLHMVLAANLLNAVGGKPDLLHRKFVPTYPSFLPHSARDFKVHLRPFSPEAIKTFLRIESPMKPGAKPRGNKYHSIGQFYSAVRAKVEEMEHRARRRGKTIFIGKRSHQVDGSAWYYGGGGEPMVVHDLASARKAIEEIMEQGEGLDHTIFDGDEQFGQVQELAHYFRFNEVALGRRYLATDTPKDGPTGPELPVDWSARLPMEPDPKIARYKRKPEIHLAMAEFNTLYSELLQQLHQAFNGKPAKLREAVPLMYQLKYRAQALMAVPTGKANGSTVGPSFELSAPSAPPRPRKRRRSARARRRK